jgi:hypothetical protein
MAVYGVIHFLTCELSASGGAHTSEAACDVAGVSTRLGCTFRRRDIRLLHHSCHSHSGKKPPFPS